MKADMARVPTCARKLTWRAIALTGDLDGRCINEPTLTARPNFYTHCERLLPILEAVGTTTYRQSSGFDCR
jgi:chemotaxis family two-component system response regulator Rcp1